MAVSAMKDGLPAALGAPLAVTAAAAAIAAVADAMTPATASSDFKAVFFYDGMSVKTGKLCMTANFN